MTCFVQLFEKNGVRTQELFHITKMGEEEVKGEGGGGEGGYSWGQMFDKYMYRSTHLSEVSCRGISALLLPKKVINDSLTAGLKITTKQYRSTGGECHDPQG